MLDLLNNSPLVFCNDGVLRAEGFMGDKVVNYPLIDLQNLFKENEIFLLQFFESPISIEKDTTLSHIIFSLKPWFNLLTKYLDIDFSAYEKACFSLTTVKNRFDYLKAYKAISFTSPEFYNEKKGLRLNQTYYSSILGGFLGREDKDHCIDEYDFQSLKNIPLLLDEKQKCKMTITGSNVRNIFNTKLKGITSNMESAYFYVPAYFTFSELLKTIFIEGLYYKTPVTSDDENMTAIINEEIKMSLEELDQKESKPILSVVNEHGEEETQNYGREDIEYAFTVEFDDNFDEINYDENEIELWTYIFNSLKSSSKIRLGNIIIDDEETD